MELRHARYFVATADEGSVSAAASRVRVAQPSLSRQLRQLERELGVALFDRSGGRLHLSTAGRALLPEARSLLAQADRLRESARFHAAGGLVRLSVGAPTVTLTDVVAPFVATLGADDPDIDVLPSDGLTARAAAERGADLVITTAAPGAPFTVLPLAVLPVWAYLSPDHPWAGRDRVPLGELLDARVIALPPTATSRQTLDLAVAARGAAFAPALEAANGTLAQALAAARRGVAVVSDDPRFGLSRVAVDDGGHELSIRLLATWDSGHPGAPTIEDTATRLREFVARRYGATPAGWR